MISMSDLLTPITKDEAKTAIYGVLATLGCPTTGWFVGGVVRAIVGTVAIVVAAFSTLVCLLAQYGTRANSVGDWLTLHAQDVYNVTRIDATFATGVLTIVKTGGAVYVLAPGDFSIKNPAGKTFHNSAAMTVTGSGVTLYMDLIADEAGSGSNTNTGVTWTALTPLSGCVYSNAAPLIGTDAESDEALRARCISKLDSLSPLGAPGAYDYFARSCGQGVTRTLITGLNGVVTAYVGTPTGPIGATELAAVDLSIQANAVPLGVTADVLSATALDIPIIANVYVNATSKTDLELQTAIITNLTNWMAARPIGGDYGGNVYLDAISTTIKNSDPSIYHVWLGAPMADVAVGSAEAPVCATLPIPSILRPI